MDYKNVIEDFADRTRTNLALVERYAANGGEAYEVTQLINSLLGLLVSPRERLPRRIPRTQVVGQETVELVAGRLRVSCTCSPTVRQNGDTATVNHVCRLLAEILLGRHTYRLAGVRCRPTR